jgi:hypothetical protein
VILNPPFMISGRLLPTLKINDSYLSYDQDTTLFYLDTPEMCVTIDDFTPGYSMGVQGCFESLLSFMSYAADESDSDLFEPEVLRWCQQNEEEINWVKYELRDNLDLIQ